MALVNWQIHCVRSNNNMLASYLDNLAAYSGIFYLTEEKSECEVTGRWLRSALIQGEMKIPCYVTLHGKKLIVQARHYSRKKWNWVELAHSSD